MLYLLVSFLIFLVARDILENPDDDRRDDANENRLGDRGDRDPHLDSPESAPGAWRSLR
jgi:hypothetical protein